MRPGTPGIGVESREWLDKRVPGTIWGIWGAEQGEALAGVREGERAQLRG